MDRLEQRFFTQAELRVADDGAVPGIGGYIARFNARSENFGWGFEVVAPGAFSASIARDDIRALWNHNSDLVLGRTSAGTLKLEEDDIGLKFENTPPDAAWVKDKLVSVRRKDVTGCSFGFYTDEDEWHTDPDGSKIRTLKKVTLVEVSPGVTFPAYPQTDVAVRSMEAWIKREIPPAAAGQTAAIAVEMEMRKRRLRLQEMLL